MNFSNPAVDLITALLFPVLITTLAGYLFQDQQSQIFRIGFSLTSMIFTMALLRYVAPHRHYFQRVLIACLVIVPTTLAAYSVYPHANGFSWFSAVTTAGIFIALAALKPKPQERADENAP